MFDLKKPCVDCPFRKDGTMIKSLGKGRIEEILNAIVNEDGFFSCHKTIDYSKEVEERRLSTQKFCAGALIAIEKADATLVNKNTRIAMYLNMYNPSELQKKECVIEPKDYI